MTCETEEVSERERKTSIVVALEPIVRGERHLSRYLIAGTSISVEEEEVKS